MYLSSLSEHELSVLKRDNEFLRDFITDEMRRETVDNLMREFNSDKDRILKDLMINEPTHQEIINKTYVPKVLKRQAVM